jgi:hypothetical protein
MPTLSRPVGNSLHRMLALNCTVSIRPFHLDRRLGIVKVFRTVDPHGNADYCETNRLDMRERSITSLRIVLGWWTCLSVPSSSSPVSSVVSFVWSVRRKTTDPHILVNSSWSIASMPRSNPVRNSRNSLFNSQSSTPPGTGAYCTHSQE